MSQIRMLSWFSRFAWNISHTCVKLDKLNPNFAFFSVILIFFYCLFQVSKSVHLINVVSTKIYMIIHLNLRIIVLIDSRWIHITYCYYIIWRYTSTRLRQIQIILISVCCKGERLSIFQFSSRCKYFTSTPNINIIPIKLHIRTIGEQLNPTFIAERISIKVLTREEVKPSEILTRSRAQFGTESLSNTRV